MGAPSLWDNAAMATRLRTLVDDVRRALRCSAEIETLNPAPVTGASL
jgi:hypothetical protein